MVDVVLRHDGVEESPLPPQYHHGGLPLDCLGLVLGELLRLHCSVLGLVLSEQGLAHNILSLVLGVLELVLSRWDWVRGAPGLVLRGVEWVLGGLGLVLGKLGLLRGVERAVAKSEGNRDGDGGRERGRSVN